MAMPDHSVTWVHVGVSLSELGLAPGDDRPPKYRPEVLNRP